MRRIKIIFSYDGSEFFGYQKQPNKRTVQGVIEHVLRQIDQEPILIVASGRTDALVHAAAQVAHFDVIRNSIKVEHFFQIFNRQLPQDIRVLAVEEVDAQFHARFDVSGKEYWYRFRSLKESQVSPFSTRYITYLKDEIDLDRINEICQKYIGTHDYAAFTTAPKTANTVRTIHQFNCSYDLHEQCYIIKINGTGFLQYMIRILVAFMLEIYRGKETLEMIDTLYKTKDKLYVNAKMAPNGLMLNHVEYEKKS
ncbi:MAG: tRNA pseudouridine(38-40) synthase TruA [Culicoidibacterales bacterium]